MDQLVEKENSIICNFFLILKFEKILKFKKIFKVCKKIKIWKNFKFEKIFKVLIRLVVIYKKYLRSKILISGHKFRFAASNF